MLCDQASVNRDKNWGLNVTNELKSISLDDIPPCLSIVYTCLACMMCVRAASGDSFNFSITSENRYTAAFKDEHGNLIH